MDSTFGNELTVQEELVYAAISSNRNEKNISCQDHYLLYSKCRCPFVYDLQHERLLACLHGHTDEVNGQCFVERSADDKTAQQELNVISTAHDNSAIIWRLTQLNPPPDANSSPNHEILHHIKSPDGSIFQTRCSCRLEDGVFLSALTTIDGNIYLCKNEQVVQTIATDNCYFDAKLFSTSYTGTDIASKRHFRLLALAGSDKKVHIYLVHNQEQLVHVLDLAGFNDWIKCLDLIPLAGRDNEYLLAAACQDSLIQVWHLTLTGLALDEGTRVRTNLSKPLCRAGEESEIRLTATLETVLSGHEGFVHSLCWFGKRRKVEPGLLRLISCSADRTIIIWQSTIAAGRRAESSGGGAAAVAAAKYEQHAASEGVWKQVVQLGETSEANVPFLGVCLSQDERSIFGQSWRGAIHRWRNEICLDGALEGRQDEQWQPETSITGHFDAVTDLIWPPGGQYLLSASLDKTTRLHGISSADNKWHELARPQVHGFEINCLAPLNSIKFASGAEEKTIRTYEATQFFVKNFETLTQTKLPLDCPLDELPAHAQLPALGLSNRGSQFPFDVLDREGDDRPGGAKLEPSGDQAAKSINMCDSNSWHSVSALAKQLASTDHLDSVPHEEILIQSTLWWEKNKLFGHCNELHTLATTSNSQFLASASRANRADLATVIVWETDKFRKAATLEHHNLTVTRLRFSPDDQHLLSVSRDRTWCLFERNPNGQVRNAYRKLIGTVKSNAVHERIIWDCAWTHDSKFFCTVSRDKKALVWSLDQLKSTRNMELSAGGQSLDSSVRASRLFDWPVQACDSPLISVGDRLYLFAFGFEDGSLELHLLSPPAACPDEGELEWRALKRLDAFHQLPIRRLSFQPPARQQQSENNVTSSSQSARLLLASGGDDHTIRLTRLRVAAIR